MFGRNKEQPYRVLFDEINKELANSREEQRNRVLEDLKTRVTALEHPFKHKVGDVLKDVLIQEHCVDETFIYFALVYRTARNDRGYARYYLFDLVGNRTYETNSIKTKEK